MFKKINWKTLRFVLAAVFVAIALYAPTAHAAIVNCGNQDGGSPSEGCHFSDLFGSAINLINYFLSGAAVIAVGGVVYGGFLMVTSAGNATKQGAGKKAVTNSLIGLGVILVAFLLIKSVFVILGFKGGANPLENPTQFINGPSGNLIDSGVPVGGAK